MPVLRPLDLVAITSAYNRDTLRNIRETKEFILNIPGIELAEQVMFCAKSLPPEVNEIKAAGLTESQGAKVKVPRITECLGWIECVLEKEIPGENYVITLGKVLHAEVKDEYCQGNGFDLSRFRPLYSGWEGKMMTICEREDKNG